MTTKDAALVTLAWKCNRRVGEGRARLCGATFTATATRAAHSAGRAQTKCTGCARILTQTPERCAEATT
jgi:hypothetical protein